jgi:hypothetical protein
MKFLPIGHVIYSFGTFVIVKKIGKSFQKNIKTGWILHLKNENFPILWKHKYKF